MAGPFALARGALLMAVVVTLMSALMGCTTKGDPADCGEPTMDGGQMQLGCNKSRTCSQECDEALRAASDACETWNITGKMKCFFDRFRDSRLFPRSDSVSDSDPDEELVDAIATLGSADIVSVLPVGPLALAAAALPIAAFAVRRGCAPAGIGACREADAALTSGIATELPVQAPITV
mmetsp:Transcript_108938/g.304939  ORF Transcript_108938/g.304939 Transcript_108938/m.304939 type:complete len:179 (-) Transcript_108938:35-571(-)